MKPTPVRASLVSRRVDTAGGLAACVLYWECQAVGCPAADHDGRAEQCQQQVCAALAMQRLQICHDGCYQSECTQ